MAAAAIAAASPTTTAAAVATTPLGKACRRQAQGNRHDDH
jgi:hypothetical protein